MDEEESFARLLSAATPAPRPSLYTAAADDPWANPFGGSDAWTASSAMPDLRARTPSPEPTLESDYDGAAQGTVHGHDDGHEHEHDHEHERERPDPPSVIAAREREELAAAAGGFGSAFGHGGAFASPTANNAFSATGFEDPYAAPGWSPPRPTAPSPASTQPSPRSPKTNTARTTSARAIPAGLIDDELLTERDARTSLTRAFVKSGPSPTEAKDGKDEVKGKKGSLKGKKEAYVFRPKVVEHKVVEHKEVKKEEAKTEEKGEDKEAKDDNKDGKKDEAETEAVKPETPAKAGGEGEGEAGAPAPAAAPQVTVDSSEAPAATESTDSTDPTEPAPEAAAAADKPAPDTHPATIPLPESRVGTPPVFHSDTPRAPGAGASKRASLSAPAPAPAHVSVSPLETPASEATSDYGFRSLAIGASGTPAPSQPLSSSPTSRFGGRGWGAVDAEPLAATAVVAEGDPWNQGGGWGEPRPIPTEQETLQSPEDQSAEAEAEAADDAPPLSATLSIERKRSNSASSPRRSKLLSTPLFQITVSDPTKVGDPVRGHVVYTVRTKTTSPHYRRGDFSVLRRFSDFLWLFEQLSANNPGVIVPPVPDKQPFGRFQDQFIETRRTALQRCLAKMTAHPILQLDPDLRLFLESDSFALDVKNRRMAPVDGAATPSSGFMSSWTGPRYVEHDEWFDQRKTYLDHLEGQLKGMSKALDAASKARLEMAMSVGEFADAAQVLADSDLGAAMCAALARLADLGRKERTAGEDQAKADVAQLLNLADEYIRFIASVRLAFASRVRAYHVAQTAEKDVMRIRKQREKDRQAGRLGDRAASSMAEVQESERRARDANADFDAQTKLVKSEFARFERERVDEFRRTLTAHLDDQIARQSALVTAWEEYHAMLLKMVQRAQHAGE